MTLKEVGNNFVVFHYNLLIMELSMKINKKEYLVNGVE
jgi:hypothetical protein